MRPYLLHHLLEHTAERSGDAVALVDGGEQTSFATLYAHSAHIGAVLVDMGVRQGDRVALLAHNSRFYAASIFGISRVGAIAVALNTGADPGLLKTLLRDSGTRVLIAGKGADRLLHRALVAGVDIDVLIAEEGACQIPSVPDRVRRARIPSNGPYQSVAAAAIIDQNLACIVYTSGSTGRPRGAMLTHLNCLSNAFSVLAYLPISSCSSILAVLPFYYIYGQSILFTHVAAGAKIVIENGFMYPQRAVENLQKQECTGFSGVPSTFAILLNRTDFAYRALPALQYVTQAGGAMTPAITRRLIDALDGKKLFVMYGATEASGRLSYVPAEDLKDAVGCIGRPVDNVELRVLADDGSECPPGVSGEIVARGSCIMQGYWNDPEETRGVLDEAGYHTGDLGCVQEGGYLAVVGRKKDMIKAGGHRVSAKEVEEHIAECNNVHEVAVVGVPDEILGEAIVAYVVGLTGEIDSKLLAKEISEKLPPYKRPQRIVAVRELPKNDSEGYLKASLREDAL